MKIEKINDNQIRCTLTHADLVERQLKLSELAYGTEKAKSLFRDMMQQAAFEFGFEADDIPLMIEAIPASSDSIVLIITKVEDPDELDTRFSKFSPSPQGSLSDQKRISMLERLKKLDGAEEFLDILKHVKATVTEAPPSEVDNEVIPEPVPAPKKKTASVRLFSFSSLDGAIHGAKLLSDIYDGANTLYKDNSEDVYILALTRSDHDPADFSRICNMLSEYGSVEKGSGATLAYLEEHCEKILSPDAVQQMAIL